MSKHALMLSTAVMLGLAMPTMAQQSDEAQTAPSSRSYDSSDQQQAQAPQSSQQDTNQQDSSVYEPQNAYGDQANQEQQSGPSNSDRSQNSYGDQANQSSTQQTANGPEVRFYVVRPADIRASDLIGMKVYNEANEQIGDVADLVLDEDANLKAIVLDVGSYVGGGDRDVAIEPDTVVIEQQTPGENRIVLHITKDSLQNAPAFKTAQAPQANGDDANQP
jgi:sporulation protein YlmC with PRC-barrel domain